MAGHGEHQFHRWCSCSLWCGWWLVGCIHFHRGGLQRRPKTPGGVPSQWAPWWVRSATFADGSMLFPVQATQIGLVWRLARRAIAFQSGMLETEFQDVSPWQEAVVNEPARQSSTSTGVKEKVLKMSSLIDQSDDSEPLPPGTSEINTWLQNYQAIMRALPEEAEEPSPNQLEALAKRVFKDDAPPYVDFGVFGPYERKLPRCTNAESLPLLGMGRTCRRTCLGHPPTKGGWPHGEYWRLHYSCSTWPP